MTEIAVTELVTEVHVGQIIGDQVELPLASEGVLRYVWESRYGPMLIEVKEGRSYVNGKAVQLIEGNPSTMGTSPPVIVAKTL